MAKNNSSVRAGAIENAEEIIERFGGIRPMAAKIDTPVTTVQGWKKRNVIPGTRRADIMSAAKDLNIDLSDVMSSEGVANTNTQKPKAVKKAENKSVKKAPKKKEAVSANPQKEKLPSPYEAVEAKAANQQKPEGIKAKVTEKKVEKKSVVKTEVKTGATMETVPSQSKPQSEQPSRAANPSTDADVLQALEESNKKTLINTIWIVTGLLLLSALVLSLFFWPQAKVIEEQQQTISALQNKVEDVDKKTSLLDSIVPTDMKNSWDEIKTRTQNDLEALQNQAKNTQIALEQLKERTTAISEGVIGADAGPLSQRLSVIEEQLATMNGGENGRFAALIERIQNLEATVPGQMQFKDSIGELQTIVDGLDGQVNTLEGRLEEAQGSDGALGQTLEGVSGNDLKAAAMLIAFSQLRDSLNREGSFEDDLVLLDKMVGEDNVELKTAIAELAPHAQQGVLTRQGLSKEFRGLAGDIVVSSLKGEDISIKERAKARLNDVMTIKKDGELVTGTQTQATVAKAQALLDAGDIQGAMVELQTLEGGAAEQAQPFLSQIKATLQAEETQQLLRNSILSKVTGQLENLGGNVGGFSGLLNGELPSIPTMTMPAIQTQGVEGVPSMNPQAIMNSIQGAIQTAPNLGGAQGFNMDTLKNTLEENVTPNEVVRDEESGFSILPQQQGFKGFSAGQR